MDQLIIGDIKITWLKGGIFHLDGGAMFGVVPKVLWEKKYPANEKNQITQCCDPLLIETAGKKILVESGLGRGKLNEKQKKIFGVMEEGKIEESLSEMGFTPGDIDYILMTHLHFDHAGGLTTWQNGKLKPFYPRAEIVVSETEWQEMRFPNIRSRNTYWKENWEPVQEQVKVFAGEKEVLPGVNMCHTGGHSAGHCLVTLESRGEKVVHLGDLLPTHAHQNPLWVMAYDDFPLNSITAKEKWLAWIGESSWWTTFYHDVYYRGLKLNKDRKIEESLKASDRLPYR